MTMASVRHEDRAAARVQEFSALREEIAGRSKAQHTLIQLSITAIGAIGAFVLAGEGVPGGIPLAGKGNPLLLLLIPLLIPALGMIYLDHAINITNIGNYINEVLRPELGAFHYEERVRAYEKRKTLRILLYGLPIFLIFAAGPIASLIITALFLSGLFWAEVLWCGGVFMALLYLTFWSLFVLLHAGV
jgi:hypothetical protein